MKDDDSTRSLEPSAPGTMAPGETRSSGASGGPMDLFWAGLAPFSVFAAFAISGLAVVLVSVASRAEAQSVVVLAASVFVLTCLLLLPAEYYLVKNRLDKPVARLERELRGELPWRSEGDVLLAPLRRSVRNVRDAALEASAARSRDDERILELERRLEGYAAADRFGDRVGEALVGAGALDAFAAAAAALIRQVWPAYHVVLLGRVGAEVDLRVLYRDGPEGSESTSAADGGPLYLKGSLPMPAKEALRRGFYAQSGLPFSHDPAFPEGRSFVAMGLDHQGAATGVLMAATADPVTPTAEPLRRAQPFFSVAFSRALCLLEMQESAVKDPLTCAYTYDHFLSVLRQEIARSNRYSHPLVCAVIDIDGLRRFNDAHGARAGDQAITEVAQIVTTLIRSSDMIARNSGGRFAVLLPECRPEAGAVVAERILEAIAGHPFIVRPQVVERLTAGIGVAVHPPHGVTALTLVDAAERALRQAKSAGGNAVRLAEDGPTDEG